MTLAQRFWSKVDPAPSECCWEWTAYKLRDGYGRFRVNKRMVLAHRVAYTLTKGEIPDGLIVRHTCDNPACCNPDHLILGTQADNMVDKVERKRCYSKLTATQAMEVYNSPLKQDDVAKLYNIDQTTVSLIKLKNRWKHIHN
jgi:hypothetical protein